MHFLHPYVILSVACGSLVNAAPASKCSPVDTVYALLRGPLQAQASSLCLSFLGGDKTVQQTQTLTVTGPGAITTVTAAPQTQTTVSETTEFIPITQTQTVQQPDVLETRTITTTTRVTSFYNARKREALATPGVVPGPLAVFASSRISSACRCVVTPATRTITTTRTQSVAGPQLTQTQLGGTVTVTDPLTIQVTLVDTITTTLPPTATSTQTFVTTRTQTVIVI